MHVLVKVIGFSPEERHAIQTMLRLSQEGDVRFRLWKAADKLAPNVLLLDADSLEAALEVQSPSFTQQTKSIVVGGTTDSMEGAWRVFQRPLNWAEVLNALEGLFVVARTDISLHAPEEELQQDLPQIPPGYKTALIIGLEREQQMYLKARLSLQGIAHVLEASDAGQAADYLSQQGFDIVIVSQQLPDADSSSLIQALRAHTHTPHAIIVVMAQNDWASMQKIESLGVAGVLELPFSPHQVAELFARI
jgi:CheY-like chemotaxis protein